MKSEEFAATPVLKWAGGKRALLRQYERYFPERFAAYHEPFVGGAAVFFHLRQRMAGPIHLSDVNAELINLYTVLRDEVEALVSLLRGHSRKHDGEYFYKVRSQRPRKPVERAARMVYLNKTCFNGLYRVNSKGQFNVPMGRYQNPTILDEERLLAASQALQGVHLHHETFEHVLERAQPGDLVYFDPPYQPLTRTANFTSYTADSFSEADQARLAEVFGELSRRGVQVLLSNSDTELVRKLYRPFKLKPIQAPRFINSKADARKAIGELLVLGVPRKALAACT